MTEHTFRADIRPGSKVLIDGHKDMEAKVLCVAFYMDYSAASVTWCSNGSVVEQWFDT